MVRECPNCKLVNPPTAEQCDCGYDFLHPGPVRRPPRQGSAAAGCLGAAFGGVIGPIIGLLIGLGSYPPPAPNPEHVDNVAPALLAFGIAACGALIGPVVGAFAGLLLNRWFGRPAFGERGA
jgi:hypothetical protein